MAAARRYLKLISTAIRLLRAGIAVSFISALLIDFGPMEPAYAQAANDKASVDAPRHSEASDSPVDAPELLNTTIAQNVRADRNLVDVDRELYLELIELSRFNVQFHLSANYHQKWRSITYPLGREAGTAVAFGGTVTDLHQQGKNLNHPRGISRGAVKDSIACGITGSALSGSASSLELVQNAWVIHQARKKGYSPQDCIEFVKAKIKTTDALLAEREALTAIEPSEGRRKVRELETTLVKRIRQQLVYEFSNWSCHSRDQMWRENTFYTIDALQSFTRMSAAVLARKALQEPDLAGGGIICALVANSAATVNPILRNLVGRAVASHHRRRLAKEFDIKRPASLEGPLIDELRDLQHHHPGTEQDEELLAIALMLHQRSERIDTNLVRETSEIERYRQIAQQQSVSGPLIGLTGVAGSILSAVAFFDYRQQPRTANKLAFSGRISNATGQAYALLNTPYTVGSGIRRNRRLRKQGLLPTQILEERLKNLDKFEQQVKSARN
jgi:hypothetical protein